MKLILPILVSLLFFHTATQAQEIPELRTTKYVFELNAIKHQTQVDSVANQTKAIKHVTNCDLNWLNYSMEVTVKEGGNLGSFPMESLKAILIQNNVELKKFTKETIN
jgi:hypothetical protein